MNIAAGLTNFSRIKSIFHYEITEWSVAITSDRQGIGFICSWETYGTTSVSWNGSVVGNAIGQGHLWPFCGAQAKQQLHCWSWQWANAVAERRANRTAISFLFLFLAVPKWRFTWKNRALSSTRETWQLHVSSFNKRPATRLFFSFSACHQLSELVQSCNGAQKKKSSWQFRSSNKTPWTSNTSPNTGLPNTTATVHNRYVGKYSPFNVRRIEDAIYNSPTICIRCQKLKLFCFIFTGFDPILK